MKVNIANGNNAVSTQLMFLVRSLARPDKIWGQGGTTSLWYNADKLVLRKLYVITGRPLAEQCRVGDYRLVASPNSHEFVASQHACHRNLPDPRDIIEAMTPWKQIGYYRTPAAPHDPARTQ